MNNSLTSNKIAQTLNVNAVMTNRIINSIKIDSRAVEPGDLFIALIGEQYNGHDYVDAALTQGAVLAIVSQRVPVAIPQLIVQDTASALAILGKMTRLSSLALVAGITGSCGKTTVKELLASILMGSGKVLASYANYNNEIGVPLTLLKFNSDHTYGVIEMGAKRCGDINHLTQLALPDVAVILNVRPSHLEGFGTIETIAKTKGEILNGLKSSGTAVLPYDDKFFSFWKQQLTNRKCISFGLNTAADVSASEINYKSDGRTAFILSVFSDKRTIELPLHGQHNIYNCLAAVAGALALGLTFEVIVARIPSLSTLDNRFKLKTGMNGVSLVDDTYNANPAAVKAALHTVCLRQEKKKIFVFADMAELGSKSDYYHRDIGCYAKKLGIDQLYCYGKHVSETVGAFGQQAVLFDSIEILIEHVKLECDSDTIILIKGSRIFGLESVVSALQVKENRDADK